MSCPICNSEKVVKGGLTTTGKQRFRCKACGHSFIIRTNNYRKRITEKKRRVILSLSKIRKPVNKFDATKKTTYSTRDIAMIGGFSKSFVAGVLNDYKLRRRGE